MKISYLVIIFISVFTIVTIELDKNTPSMQVLSDQIQDKEPKQYDKPDKAAQWLMELRQTLDYNKTPSQLNNQFKSEIEADEYLKKSSTAKNLGVDNAISKLKFENIGPSNFGGRIRGFVIKTDDSSQLLAGGVSGGVFKSDNKGQ
ncbi:MAG: hypothetical protein AB8B80_01090 [Marinicellaceae bacterium]